MSITDELREYAEKYECKSYCKLLTDIAERIDAEYQKAIRELNNFADASVLLPVDADGVPIRFGDKVTVSWSEKVYEVRGFSYTQQLADGERTIWVDVYSLEKMGNIPLCAANSCHHYHAPTVEDLILDTIARCIGHSPEYWDEPIAECAAKLQLAEGKVAE